MSSILSNLCFRDRQNLDRTRCEGASVLYVTQRHVAAFTCYRLDSELGIWFSLKWAIILAPFSKCTSSSCGGLSGHIPFCKIDHLQN